MRYRLTCVTPVLVGDGRRLSAIDYMVWKDHVNVLDQPRIFRLLSKGPRLDGYLAQLKKATKLDFASWGGFAQNFADRRIPFENPAYAAYWERAAGESLNIPTFSAGASGAYLPGSAIKGALRSGMLFTRLKDATLHDLAARASGERPLRRPGEVAEDQLIGANGASRSRFLGVADSAPVDTSHFKIFLLRVSTLVPRGREELTLGWKQSPRGAADGKRPEDSAPLFAEMASPGTSFEGQWQEKSFLDQPDVRRALGWREPLDRRQIFDAANQFAAGVLAAHKQYAARAGLDLLGKNLEGIEATLSEAREAGGCLLSIGWGGGLLGKSAWLDTNSGDYRQILKTVGSYNNALASGLPFPKTRHVVFLDNRPATLPGWVRLDIK